MQAARLRRCGHHLGAGGEREEAAGGRRDGGGEGDLGQTAAGGLLAGDLEPERHEAGGGDRQECGGQSVLRGLRRPWRDP